MNRVCDHWSGAERTYCGSTTDVLRYLVGLRCPNHRPGAAGEKSAPASASDLAVASSTSVVDLGECAAQYVEQLKWRIFPLRARSKEPLTIHGVKDASRDPAQIRAWWERWPDANIGVACGPDSVCCLDIDSKGASRGEHFATAAQAAGLLDGWIAELRTPSGGRHLWYPGSAAAGGALGKTRDLEFKASGGYVLLPPSFVLNKDGTTGTYEIVARKDEGWPLDWPRLRDFCQPPRAPRPAYAPRPGRADTFDGLIKAVEGQGPESSNRNNVLHWAACAAYRQGAPGHVIDAIAAASVSNGLGERDVWATIRSAARGATK